MRPYPNLPPPSFSRTHSRTHTRTPVHCRPTFAPLPPPSLLNHPPCRSPSRAQIGASNRLRPPSAAVPRRSKSRGQSRSQSRSQSRAFATQDGHLMASHARRSTTFGGRKSTTSFGQGLEPHAESPEVSGRLAGIQKAIANSSYIHYEFVPPHDERTSKNDMVIHHNSGKVFVDGEMRVASWEKLSDDVLCGYDRPPLAYVLCVVFCVVCCVCLCCVVCCVCLSLSVCVFACSFGSLYAALQPFLLLRCFVLSITMPSLVEQLQTYVTLIHTWQILDPFIRHCCWQRHY